MKKISKYSLKTSKHVIKKYLVYNTILNFFKYLNEIHSIISNYNIEFNRLFSIFMKYNCFYILIVPKKNNSKPC